MFEDFMAVVKIIALVVMIGGIMVAIPLVGAALAVITGVYTVYSICTHKDDDPN